MDEQELTPEQQCGAEGAYGDRCVLKKDHNPRFGHATEPGEDGMVLGWGAEWPENMIQIECPRPDCDVSVVGDAQEPLPTMIHHENGTHTIEQAGNPSYTVGVQVVGPTEVDKSELVDYLLMPEYHVTTKVDGNVIGKFEKPIPDPFPSTTVQIAWRDLFKAVLRRKSMEVRVEVGGNWDAIRHVLTQRPIRALPPRPVGGIHHADLRSI